MTGFVARLRCDRGGMAAVEFAVALPILLSLLFGTFEAANGVITYMKLIAAADTVADLMAQAQLGQTYHSADINNFYTAGQLVMSPASGAGLGMAVASVSFNAAGTPSVAWQQTRGGATSMGDAASTSVGLGGPGDSVIVATVTYTYVSALKYIMRTPLVMSQRVYARPRLVASIPYS